MPRAHRRPHPLGRPFPAAIALAIALPLCLGAAECDPNARDRVRIVDNHVVADNGVPLRGEHIYLAEDFDDPYQEWLDRIYDVEYWLMLRDEFHLNAVRLLVSRPPQNWSSSLGEDCFTPAYRCYPLDHVFANGKTTIEVIDDAVAMANSVGMYLILDYHAVGGWNAADAFAWWGEMAPRYADEPHVIYDALNEPAMWHAEAFDSDDVTFVASLYAFLRNLAPATHIILWGFGGATDAMRSVVEQAPSIDYANASVGFHPYVFDTAAVEDLRAAYPVIASEVGGHGPGEFASRTDTAESLGLSWIWLDGAKGDGIKQNGLDPSFVDWPSDPALP